MKFLKRLLTSKTFNEVRWFLFQRRQAIRLIASGEEYNAAPVEEHDAVAHMMRAHRAKHGPAPVELKSLRKLAKVHGVAETKLAEELRKRGAKQKLFIDVDTQKGTRLWKLFPDEKDV